MLLLSRLYQYSSGKFFRLLKSVFFGDSFEPELTFKLQEKCVDSVPDAVTAQESFKIVVETKMSDWFYTDQLMRYISIYRNLLAKSILTIDYSYPPSPSEPLSLPLPELEPPEGVCEPEVEPLPLLDYLEKGLRPEPFLRTYRFADRKTLPYCAV